MTNNGRLAMGEIDMGRDLISLDLGYCEVIHIPGNPISAETIHIRGDLNNIGTGLPPESRATPRLLTFSGESS